MVRGESANQHEIDEDASSDPSVSAPHPICKATPLCEVCQLIFQGDLLSPSSDGILRYPTRHHANLREAKSAASKCYICRELTKQVESDTQGVIDPVEYDKPLSYSIFQGPRDSDNGWKSLVINIGKVAPIVMYQFELVPAKDVDRNEVLDENTGSLVTLANLATLIRNCDEEHTTCIERFPNWHPTRLLEIQRSGGNTSDMIIRIVELALEIKLRYAALSHCWGGIVPIMLTKSSAASLYRGIRSNELPKTFRDAVHAASFLGLQCLWIDSLCIAQDDEEDWQREASQMRSVYQSAFVTIAATAGATSEDGLFRERDSALVRPPVVATQWHQSPLLILFTRHLQRELDKAPLNRRGWVLQERLLSRRIIHFTSDQVVLECGTGITSETFPAGLAGAEYLEGPVYTPPAKPWTFVEDVTKFYSQYHATSWSETIRDYTARSLSKETDKLPAIAGLASKWAAITCEKYTAGMWEPRLVLQLPWMLGDNNRNVKSYPRKCHAYVAPSWSFVFWTGPITPSLLLDGPFKAHEITQLATVTEIQLQYATEDEFGELTGGWLRIEAIAAEASIFHDATNGGGRYVDNYPFQGGLDFGDTGMTLDGTVVPATATLLDTAVQLSPRRLQFCSCFNTMINGSRKVSWVLSSNLRKETSMQLPDTRGSAQYIGSRTCSLITYRR